MRREDWQEIERLYQASIGLQPHEWDGFLAAACDDDGIRREVRSLLAHRDRLSFIERSALDAAAEMSARDPAEPLVGRTVGRYEITALLGAGGMGVVYRAHDTRLGRDVALKLLPAHVSHDPESQIRAEREARLLASLNHPNIAGIYDLDESIGCLVLEFVQGETLAERIGRGAVLLPEALAICRQIADALEAAHEHGVVHRDLKPANVMITPNGSVKVLDFGIAGILAGNSSSTLPRCDTSAEAAIVGTPSYMSPEQSCGHPADKRTDIWAFGCVLYEMLTGTKAYVQETTAATLAAVPQREPNWSALPKGTPPRIVNLLRRCLQTDPHWRLRDIGDARIELADTQNEPRDATAVGTAQHSRPVWAGSIVIVALIAAVVAWKWHPVAATPEMRVEVATPQTTDPVSLAISPDGESIVFVATAEGRSRLWLRSLASTSPRPLPGTDNASCPFWSPDNAAVGFFADGKLKRIDVDTGSVRTLTPALSCGGSWNSDGTILFSSPMFGPISRISAAGGGLTAATRITHTDRPRQTGHRFPQFLPDGRQFLYYAVGDADGRGVYVADLNGSRPRRLIDADAAAVYHSSGHLFFLRQHTLFAQKFDPSTATLTGTAVPVDAQVAFDPTRNMTAISASSTGVLVYRAGPAVGRRQFVWLDRAGNEIRRVGDPDSASALDPALSPDEQQVALHRTINGRQDIWFLETKHAALSRFTSEGVTGERDGAIRPIWSPDGTQIVFASIAKLVTDLFRRPVAGGNAELILETDEPKAATDWSADGRFLLYRSHDPKTLWDIWALTIDNNGRPGARIQVVRTSFDETNGQLSPDAKWVAYQSNDTGRFEIYVQPFLRTGRRLPISKDGGAQVRWRRDGKELFYVSLDDRLTAVPIGIASDGQSLEIGTPAPLFAIRSGGAVQGANRQQYMPSADGQRFLVNSVLEEPAAPITVLLNWKGIPR